MLSLMMEPSETERFVQGQPAIIKVTKTPALINR